MLRHYRALHENKEETGASHSQATRKQELDEALVSMIVKDTQTFSIVEDVGFRALVSKLDPIYVLPTRQALKAMVEAKYESAKEKAKAKVAKVAAVSLTSDIHQHGCLPVWVCHANAVSGCIIWPSMRITWSKAECKVSSRDCYSGKSSMERHSATSGVSGKDSAGSPSLSTVSGDLA
ncbi:uncharacterized protein AB9W97_008178 [Spinachia spinachia]